MTDETPTIEQPGGDEEPTQPQPQGERPRRLLRSSDDRVLGGVAGGLGRYFGVDAIIFRIGFALSLFFGGLGAVAYLLLAVFVPSDTDPDRARFRGMGFWRGAGIVLLALIAIGGLFTLAGGAAFAVALGWGVPVAIVIIAIGGLLALTAFRGGGRWLIPPAVALAVGAGVAAASDVDLSGGIGEREYRPLTAEAIPEDGYRLGVGRLAIDLRGLDWQKERVVPLEASLGTGQLDVYVPERVCVSGESHLRAGQSVLAGQENHGVDVDDEVGVGSNAVPRLDLDADLDLGQIRVINDDDARVADENDGDFDDDDGSQAHRDANEEACAA